MRYTKYMQVTSRDKYKFLIGHEHQWHISKHSHWAQSPMDKSNKSSLGMITNGIIQAITLGTITNGTRHPKELKAKRNRSQGGGRECHYEAHRYGYVEPSSPLIRDKEIQSYKIHTPQAAMSSTNILSLNQHSKRIHYLGLFYTHFN